MDKAEASLNTGELPLFFLVVTRFRRPTGSTIVVISTRDLVNPETVVERVLLLPQPVEMVTSLRWDSIRPVSQVVRFARPVARPVFDRTGSSQLTISPFTEFLFLAHIAYSYWTAWLTLVIHVGDAKPNIGGKRKFPGAGFSAKRSISHEGIAGMSTGSHHSSKFFLS